MKCTEQQLIDRMISLYDDYKDVERIRKMFKKEEDLRSYEAGYTRGAIEVLEVILLQVLGGQEMSKLWNKYN